jgi:hypothetical protein
VARSADPQPSARVAVRVAAFVAVALLAALLAGCVTTQQKSERAHAQATRLLDSRNHPRARHRPKARTHHALRPDHKSPGT